MVEQQKVYAHSALNRKCRAMRRAEWSDVADKGELVLTDAEMDKRSIKLKDKPKAEDKANG